MTAKPDFTSDEKLGLSITKKVQFSIATFGSAILRATITLFTYFYYREVIFLDLLHENELIILSLLGTALAIGWWVQALMNPLIGWLSDRTISIYGRRKIWIILGAPLTAISFVAIYMFPFQVTDIITPLIWLTIFFSLYNAAYAFTVVPYVALIPEIATTPEERTSLSSYRTGFNLLGTVIGSLIGALIEFEVLLTSFIAVFFVITFFISTITIDSSKITENQLPRESIFSSIRSILDNKPFKYYLGFVISISMFQNMLLDTIPVFGREIIFKGEKNFIGSLLSGVFVITSILFLIPSKDFINRTGKKRTALLSVSITILLLPMLFTVGMIQGFELIHLLILLLLLGIPIAPIFILPDSIISDITDYDEITNGKKREAMHFATQGIFTRIAGGTAIQLMAIIHGIFGSTYPNTLGLSLTGPIAALFLIFAIIMLYLYPENEVISACEEKQKRIAN